MSKLPLLCKDIQGVPLKKTLFHSYISLDERKRIIYSETTINITTQYKYPVQT